MAVERYRVIISYQARNSLREIVLYISKRSSKTVAERVRAKLIQRVKSLAVQPNSFPKEHFLNDQKGDYYFLVQWSYKIIYEVKGDQVRILDFFHTSQHPGKIES